jgi:hypothetical protein
MAHDFAAEIGAARSRLDAEPFLAAQELRSLEEGWARQMLGVEGSGDIATVVRQRVKAALDPTIAGEVSAHLAEAEKWQAQIGSYATGAGEGLTSMGALRSLQMARAWIEATLSRTTGYAASTKRALALASKIEGDANGLGARHTKSLRELRAFLSATALATGAAKAPAVRANATIPRKTDPPPGSGPRGIRKPERGKK